jgi:putative transposase
LRARLVKRAENWAWGSLRARLARGGSELLAEPPVGLPRNWRAAVNAPQTEAEIAAIRHSIQRGTPFGSESWTKRAARRLGLESTLRPRGRPRKGTTK